MTHTSQGTVDSLDFSTVFEREAQAGPKVTFYIPTDPTGAQAEIAALTLKNQLREAQAQLTQSLEDTAARAILTPVAELAEDSSYWRLQSRGLVIFASAGFHSAVRVPIEVRESLTVAEQFTFLPLAPVLASDRKCYILALAKNSVHLFEASRNTIEELPLENIPASFDEVIDELPERTVDIRAGGGMGDAPLSQASSGDIDRVLTEKFIHAVAKAIGTRLGTARSQPLVLASVAEYLPYFRANCPYPAVHDGVIAGNPEKTLPDALRSAAWRLLNDSENLREAEEQDRARSLAHAGKGALDLSEIARAASEGRVDTLYLPREPQSEVSNGSRDFADRALVDTLRASGTVRTLTHFDNGEEAVAVFRY